MSDQASSAGTTRSTELSWKELRHKLSLLAALLLLDALVVAVLILSEGALHWLSTLPFFGETMDRLGPSLTVAAFVQVFIIVAFLATHLLLTAWQHLFDSHGGPKPNLWIAVIATSALHLGILLYLPHEKPASEQVPLASCCSPQPQRLPALFRLQRPTRGPVRSPQQFVVDVNVTEIELKTPVAYASFKIFTLVLDNQELQGYQVRNDELSFTVDRQILPPGAHTLAVHERQKGSKRTDVQTFQFTIVDALR